MAVANGSGGWTYEQLTDAQIAAAAAIAYSKLNLATSIKNADIAAAAAIVYTKLNLAGAIQDSDILSTANLHKLAAVTGTPNGTKFLRDDGSWQTGIGYELDYTQITADVTGITATTEGTSVAVITGNSITYDGTKVRIEIQIGGVAFTAGSGGRVATLVVYRDSTVLGQIPANSLDANNNSVPVLLPMASVLYDTPSAAAHTYAVKAFTSGGTTPTLTVKAGAGGSGGLIPAFLRVTKA